MITGINVVNKYKFTPIEFEHETDPLTGVIFLTFITTQVKNKHDMISTLTGSLDRPRVTYWYPVK